METQILEINLISAQGLKPPSTNLRRLQTYAVAWVNPAPSSRPGSTPLPIFGVGYIKDFLIGTVRFLLSTCLKKMDPITHSGGGTPAFTALQIRRPSGRFQGVLNIAAAVYDSSECGVLDKVSAVSFRELMDKKEGESRRRRRLSRAGSKQSSGGESCDFSDSSESTSSTALKDWNCVREMAGKDKGSQSNGAGLLCGLIMQRKIPFCPSDRDLELWAESFEENR
ncbi:hypothetical protein F511_05560 [Dorcoceras hygrometricum]|uniref:Uncharacterized protein n=1 Tax=Dorcoceras hygrometricum TaxID=472368 RepID=A0A2Z7AL59_9LAMI|nr:hypothetical protein F511_05560 [Dorcoceras hygrometricum]